MGDDLLDTLGYILLRKVQELQDTIWQAGIFEQGAEEMMDLRYQR